MNVANVQGGGVFSVCSVAPTEMCMRGFLGSVSFCLVQMQLRMGAPSLGVPSGHRVHAFEAYGRHLNKTSPYPPHHRINLISEPLQSRGVRHL